MFTKQEELDDREYKRNEETRLLRADFADLLESIKKGKDEERTERRSSRRDSNPLPVPIIPEDELKGKYVSKENFDSFCEEQKTILNQILASTSSGSGSTPSAKKAAVKKAAKKAAAKRANRSSRQPSTAGESTDEEANAAGADDVEL